MQKTLDKWPGSPGIHAIAHQLGIPASTLAGLRDGSLVAVPKEHPDPDRLKDLVWDAINDAEGYPTMRQMQPLWATMLAAAPAPKGGEHG